MPTSSSNSFAFLVRAEADSRPSNIGTCTFSTAVRIGSKWNDWKTKPNFCERSRSRLRVFESDLAVEVDLARSGPVQRAEQVQQGGFAAAAGAHDGHVLTAADADRHVLNGVNLPVGIQLRQVFGAEQEGIAAVTIHGGGPR